MCAGVLYLGATEAYFLVDNFEGRGVLDYFSAEANGKAVKWKGRAHISRSTIPSDTAHDSDSLIGE